MTAYAFHAPTWHVIHRSHPGGRIVFACRMAIDYVPVLTATDPLAKLRCPACDRELKRQPAVQLHVDPVIEVDTEGEWNWQATEGGES